MEKNNSLGLDSWTWNRIIADYPDLAESTSITELSKRIFGVRSVTKLVDRYCSETAKALVNFFGTDHSSLVLWAKHSQGYWNNFHALPIHAPIYRRLIKELGIEITVRLTEDRDFSDIAIGYMFLKADKKRYSKFHKNIIEALPIFPASAHGVMIHDYIDALMKREEAKAKPTIEAIADLPKAPIEATEVDGYKVLVPTSSRDLKRIGTAQSHCVGTAGMGYAAKVREGLVYIFALYSKALADGICVEVTPSGYIVQAQGKHRRCPTLKENQAIKKIIGSIAV